MKILVPNNTPFDTVPYDALISIMHRLDVPALLALSQTSHCLRMCVKQFVYHEASLPCFNTYIVHILLGPLAYKLCKNLAAQQWCFDLPLLEHSFEGKAFNRSLLYATPPHYKKTEFQTYVCLLDRCKSPHQKMVAIVHIIFTNLMRYTAGTDTVNGCDLLQMRQNLDHLARCMPNIAGFNKHSVLLTIWNHSKDITIKEVAEEKQRVLERLFIGRCAL